MKKQKQAGRLVITQSKTYSYDVLNDKNSEQVREFMHAESLRLDPLADPAAATLAVEIDSYYDSTDVNVRVFTSRHETDDEFATRLEREREQEALWKARQRDERKERRLANEKAERETLARLKAKYEK